RLADASPAATRRRRVDRGRRGPAVLRLRPRPANPDGIHRGLRPHRLRDAYRPPLPTVHVGDVRPVGGAAHALPQRPRHRRAAVTRPRSKPLVLCLVGTDHHPFDRLVGWCDSLAERRPDADVLVQYGSTAPPRVASGVAFLDKQELTASLAEAQVAITH